MRIHEAQRISSATDPRGFPRARLPEIAFAGRSNVGKSSLLNALVGRRGMARISRRPGCTQLLHFYLLNRKLVLVDLPGYGYAKVPKNIRESWGPLVESYLDGREPLRLVWLLVDARHEPTGHDVCLAEWLRDRRIPFRVAMMKADRLKRKDRNETVRRCVRVLDLDAENAPPLLTSAREGTGIPAAWREIRAHLHQPPAVEPSAGREPFQMSPAVAEPKGAATPPEARQS